MRDSGIGVSRTISMSNTRKITASRKNRREKGTRAEVLGSNPHSKGDSFSRSWLDRVARSHESINTKEERVRASSVANKVRCIVQEAKASR